MRNRWRRAALIMFMLVIPGAVLGYGYWFGVTHGSLYVYVDDVRDREHSRPVVPVHVTFLDAAGRVLAEARGDPPDGTIFVESPQDYACHAIEQRAALSIQAQQQWDACFERQSRWIPTWIRNARFVEVQSGACMFGRRPLTVSEYPDTWWLWWVPLPHIGGKPYTSFSAGVDVNTSVECNSR